MGCIDFYKDGKTLFNLKEEYNKPYFNTMNKLLDIKNSKVVKGSFISEHMLFSKEIVLELLDRIESNKKIDGEYFFEKILFSINKNDLNKSGFSEYETYGEILFIIISYEKNLI